MGTSTAGKLGNVTSSSSPMSASNQEFIFAYSIAVACRFLENKAAFKKIDSLVQIVFFPD